MDGSLKYLNHIYIYIYIDKTRNFQIFTSVKGKWVDSGKYDTNLDMIEWIQWLPLTVDDEYWDISLFSFSGYFSGENNLVGD